MKAIILCGGKGTRLRPLTYKIPKPLIPIQNKTLTEHVLDTLKKYKITDIYLSVGYKADQIKQYFQNGSKFDIKITYLEESTPLGTAGPLIILNTQTPLNETFFMLNGDNLFDINLSEMLKFHQKNKAAATIALASVKDPTQYGVAVLKDQKIVEFVEKPKNPPSNYISSGYYILEPIVFDIIKTKKTAMMETDVFPQLAKQGKLFGFKSNGLWFDTGTFERYEQAQKEWK